MAKDQNCRQKFVWMQSNSSQHLFPMAAINSEELSPPTPSNDYVEELPDPCVDDEFVETEVLQLNDFWVQRLSTTIKRMKKKSNKKG